MPLGGKCVGFSATAHLAVRGSLAVYASSGSVYGIKEEEQVTEDLERSPINLQQNENGGEYFELRGRYGHTYIRPATVCGLSPRMRLDVSVNMLSFQALANQKITVFGGDQVAQPYSGYGPGLRAFSTHPELPSGNYNAVSKISASSSWVKMIACKTGAPITTTPSNDPRSY